MEVTMVGAGQKVSITPMQQMARTEGGDLGSRQTHCHLQLNGCFSYEQQHLQKHSLPSSLDPHFVPFFVQSQPQFEDAPGHAPTAAAVAAVRSAKARARSEYVITATLRLNCDVMDSACATQTVHVSTKVNGCACLPTSTASRQRNKRGRPLEDGEQPLAEGNTLLKYAL